MGKNKTKDKVKTKKHASYNLKEFLEPTSINSMSAIHTKIYPDGRAVARLSDCHNSIRWWNDMNKPEEVKEMVTKLDTVINVLQMFRSEVVIKDPNHIL
jgi:hypothetical protein